ncbi:phosphoglycerate kinase [Candidatus Saccharibacteria bacterium]|nr:phosphoglycerate kinase [Candidatus Saccharibacteria bacterium]
MFHKKTVRDIPVHGKRILLRTDFNVPLTKVGKISSDYRIVQALPTIRYLLERQCEVVIISHLGRPKGERNLEFTLEPVARRLSELLELPVEFVSDCCSDITKQTLKNLKSGKVTVLENVRFYPGEESNDPEFAQDLKCIINPDYVVHDEFGAIHRAHASTEGISHIVPAVAGLLLETEYMVLTQAMDNPERPLVAVLGGAKISDKLPLVERFLETADTVLVGGAMANNFISEAGHEVGTSLVDPEGKSQVQSIVTKARPGQLVLPNDVAVAAEISVDSKRRDCDLNGVSNDENILDIGFETMRNFTEQIKTAATVVWNGTLGMTELPQFAQGSDMLAQALSEQQHSTKCIIGGGDTADFVLGWLEKHPEGAFSHISTGGGASLELMSGIKLPGIEALLDI